MQPGKNVVRLGNEQVTQSREDWDKANPENEVGELKGKSLPQVKCLNMSAVSLSERTLLH